MLKIKIYEKDTSLYHFLSLCLELKGYQAERVACPALCDRCGLSGEACADALILNVDSLSSCRPFLDEQQDRRCNIPNRNKVLISLAFTAEQAERIEEYGYSFIKKPYKFSDIREWLEMIDLQPLTAA